jgi:Xaa-Pro aminopeptidase
VTLLDLDNAQFVHIFEVLRHAGVVDANAEYNRRVASLFCPHSLSHHIGASVHDWSWFDGPCLLRDDPYKAFSLVPNMVISIEPGIYFNSASLVRARTDPAYAIVNFERALELSVSVCAVRIEDDVLVLRDGREVLTTCPKAVEAIEETMRKDK